LKLSSVHQAKGLEFEAVFFVNLDHNTIPHESNDIREEKRIYYVGITRAKRLLYLCNEKNKKPSVFLN
jgi:DNA helicase-2/ATP-dependent DNA helicase PcrA